MCRMSARSIRGMSASPDAFGQQFVNALGGRRQTRIMPCPPWVCSLQMSSVPPPYGPPPQPPQPPEEPKGYQPYYSPPEPSGSPEEPQGYQPFDSYYRPQPSRPPQNARRGGFVGGLLAVLAAIWAYGKYALLFLTKFGVAKTLLTLLISVLATPNLVRNSSAYLPYAQIAASTARRPPTKPPRRAFCGRDGCWR